MGAPTPSGVDYRAVALRNLDRLPPFSPTLNRLLASLADDGVSFGRVSDVIENDSVLAGHVLRVVNSALYARSGTVNSVRHAVSLLGTEKLRNLTLSLAVTSLWSRAKTPPGWSHQKFNLHSIATAMMADLVATRVPVAYAEGAFTAGLLHDVGKLLIAVVFPGEYERIHRADWSADIEQELLSTTHAELSCAVLSRWKLPVEIQEAVAQHHSAPRDPSKPVLADLVAMADGFAAMSGISISSGEAGYPGEVLKGCGIDDQIPAICAEFEAAFDSIRSFF